MHTWNDQNNAELYDQFARKHSLYRDTSRDLVALAQLDGAATVVDLACGTGISTEMILQEVSEDARVIAIDGSDAMLAIARRNVDDPRVTWMKADGSELSDHVPEADAIICNSAYWQMDMSSTMLAISKSLRPGGRFVFNIGRRFLMMRLSPEELAPSKPSFFQIIQAVAVLDRDFAPPHPAASRRTSGLRGPLTTDSLKEMIVNAGLVLDAIDEREYDNPPEAQRDWISVPVFSDNVLPGMPHDEQLDVINSAYDRWSKESEKSRWLVFVALKT